MSPAEAEWLCNARNHTEPFTHIETECSPCGNYFPKAFVVKSADAVHTTMQTLPSDPEQQPSNCSMPRKPCPGQDALSYCPADPAPHQCSSQDSSQCF